MIPWTIKKQLIYLLVLLFIIFAVVIFIIFKVTSPTCFDGRRNQGEEGIDCGGPCAKQCLGEIKEMIVLWTKFFEISKGKYDVLALVENPNLFLAQPSVKYQFKLYDKNNVLVAIKEGETFINSVEAFPVFETNIDAGSRIPSRAFIEFEKNLNWEIVKKEKPQLIVSKKQFFNSPPFPRLNATIDNKSVAAVDNIYAVAILYDKNKNATAVSATKIDIIQGGASQEIVFTWPQPFPEEPSLIEIFLRTDLSKANAKNL